MGALYFIVSIVAAGMVANLFSLAAGNDETGNYDYNFVPGVGAVFSTGR